MYDKLYIEDSLWVLEEDGKNVLLKDSQANGVSKSERKRLFILFLGAAQAIRDGESLDPYLYSGCLKCLDRQEKAVRSNLWEIRDEGSGTRLIFVREDPDTIIVAAVSKRCGNLSQAVHRGANRWAKYKKETKK